MTSAKSEYIFFFLTFFRLQYPCGSLCTAPQLQPARMGRRLLATPVGKEFVQGGFGPASTTLSAGRQLK